MITLRKSADRGHFNHGWLDTYHTFSFGDYHDPAHMGFRSLRVINEDRVKPGQGFPTHSHRDMEIVTYILEGALEHKDSMGNSSVIRPGMVQRMTAGTGVRHSEFNPSPTEPVHLLQIWILPDQTGLPPGYEEMKINPAPGKLVAIASKKPLDGAVRVHQDAVIYAGSLNKGGRLDHAIAPKRGAWLQVVRGGVLLNGKALGEGDGASIEGEPKLTLSSDRGGAFVLFDLG
jgi:hypothetical protein